MFLSRLKIISQFLFNEKIILITGTILLRLLNKLQSFKKISEEKKIFENLLNQGFDLKRERISNIVTKINDVELGNYSVLLRRYSSDYKVFKQVILSKEYKSLVEYILKYNKPSSIQYIIDAGGNIGLTTLYLKKIFLDAQVLIIEPDADNLRILRHNIVLNSLNNITCIEGGVWNRNEQLSINRSFRDGKEWSISVDQSKDNSSYNIQGITIDHLINNFSIPYINILKIDIEGSEKYVFENIYSVAKFLPITQFLAMEIHREFGILENIKSILIHYNFDFFFSGELIIAHNRHFNTNSPL